VGDRVLLQDCRNLTRLGAAFCVQRYLLLALEDARFVEIGFTVSDNDYLQFNSPE
jgi:hypothetical protein